MAARRRPSDTLLSAVLGGLVCLVLTTGTAVAVSTTAVTITSPVTGKTAHVTNQQSLVVSHRDAVSGTYSKVDSLGRQLVGDGSGALTVDGTTGSRPLLPSRPWNTVNDMVVNGSGGTTLYQATGNKRIALTSMALAAAGPTAGSVRVNLQVYVRSQPTGNCQTLADTGWGAAERFIVQVPVGDTVNLTWPTGLMYSAYASTASQYFCVNVTASGPSGFSMAVSAVGFLV
jgi:hypothetical protein